ncbi:MAG: MFS transporter [Myxococcota bacterium]
MANETAAAKGSFGAQLRSLGGIYWIANWMELVERFAYYGVRVVLPVFMVLPLTEGGPELTHVQKGTIYAIWALVQSFVPVFSGTSADRYGYKLSIAISTVLKIIGYLLMGYALAISTSLAGGSLVEARAAGTDFTYEIFFAGAMFLALGTAIFKPGVQGLIAQQLPDSAAGLGWGLFYQMVNIGGFIGPLVAGYLRVLEWEYVFLVCAAGISLNFVPLFFFKEPVKEGVADERSPGALLVDALRGLLEPRLFFFTMAFAGFWLMFYQLFDILPNFIDDWVDSRGPANALMGLVGSDAVPTVNEGNLTQEWILNFNAFLISLFAFAVGYWTGKVRSLVAIVLGIAVSAVGIYLLGVSMTGWMTLGAIGIFSVGEMMASPTKMRYLSAIAPPGRKGQYMGYVNMTVGIGWSIGSIVAGSWYEENGDKINLARRYLTDELGLSGAADLPRGEVLEAFYAAAEVDAWGARDLLWNTYEPNGMWLLFTAIGVASMLLLVGYDRLLEKAKLDPSHSFNTQGRRWVQVALVPIIAAFAYATVTGFSVALLILLSLMVLLLVASFVFPEEEAATVDSAPTAF